ncbi:MAG: CRISPR-associated endonuclease Cas2 [Phycisphaerales bacterium]|jgi:CRISPR-associated protein Cas2|nr:CRISPR-associated endonuclease Cas2 [Phycisphaerales bacterium]
MARRHFLISYDISDDKRRTKIFNTLSSNGDHVQFSVFLCQLNPIELARLRAVLHPLINTAEDQLLILDLGKVHYDQPLPMETIGQPYVPPVRTMIV